jgi:hypothetical protein
MANRADAERDAMVRSLLLVTAFLLGGCASPSLPEAYRSKGSSGTVDCTAYPEPPAPAACRNLYEDIIHRAELLPVDTTRLQ